MILLIGYVAVKTNPPILDAAKNTVSPEIINPIAIVTLLGGTVGGYIIFSGGHRLIDAKITGEENLPKANQSAILGVSVALIVRILLFLAVLGVVSTGAALDAKDPAGSS